MKDKKKPSPPRMWGRGQGEGVFGTELSFHHPLTPALSPASRGRGRIFR
jgi:hypothetical protein